MAVIIRKDDNSIAPQPGPKPKRVRKKPAAAPAPAEGTSSSVAWSELKAGAFVEGSALFSGVSPEPLVLLVSECVEHPTMAGFHRIILRVYWHDVLLRIVRVRAGQDNSVVIEGNA